MTTKKRNEIWFDALLKVAVSESLKNEIEILPSNEELNQQYKPSDKLDRQIKKIIKRNQFKPKTRVYSSILRKVVVCIIIIFAASSVTLLSVEATRNAIFNAFISQFEQYTEVKFKDSTIDDTQNNIYSPTYLPEGFTEISTISYGNSIIQTYSDKAGNEILLKYRVAETGTELVDNENTNYKEIKIAGNTAYLFKALTKNDSSVLLWQSGGVVFELSSPINSDELIKIGNSIKK